MKTRLLWAAALALALGLALILMGTEGRYLQFLRSLNQVDTQIFWVKSAVGPEKTTLTFNVVFHNSSSLPMWVEAINTQLRLGQEYAGTYTITEGNYQVRPGEERAVPLAVTLWATRRQMLQRAQEQGEQLHLEGRARVRVGLSKTELKTFYQVKGSFSLEDDHGL